MKSLNQLFISVLLIVFGACSSPGWVIVGRSSTKIAIDSTTASTANKDYEAYLLPIKKQLDNQMNEVIGETSVTLRAHAPESLLSNLCADVYLEAASRFINQKVDISIVNLGGLRTVIPAGKVTLRKVYELMPFENELVVLWLRGDKLEELLQSFAGIGGQGVAGLRMVIKDGQVQHINIGGQTLDKNKLYSIATNDYLAGGNDKMPQLAQYERRVNTGVTVRTMMIDYIRAETKQGHAINSKLDGRISIVN